MLLSVQRGSQVPSCPVNPRIPATARLADPEVRNPLAIASDHARLMAAKFKSPETLVVEPFSLLFVKAASAKDQPINGDSCRRGDSLKSCLDLVSRLGTGQGGGFQLTLKLGIFHQLHEGLIKGLNHFVWNLLAKADKNFLTFQHRIQGNDILLDGGRHIGSLGVIRWFNTWNKRLHGEWQYGQ